MCAITDYSHSEKCTAEFALVCLIQKLATNIFVGSGHHRTQASDAPLLKAFIPKQNQTFFFHFQIKCMLESHISETYNNSSLGFYVHTFL